MECSVSKCFNFFICVLALLGLLLPLLKEGQGWNGRGGGEGMEGQRWKSRDGRAGMEGEEWKGRDAAEWGQAVLTCPR